MADLRQQAQAIWLAGVRAVDSERLVKQAIQRSATELTICGHVVPLDRLGRLVVVGAGKAGAGMAAAFEEAVGSEILQRHVQGWVNVPADCVRPLEKIPLHAARPAGVNEPTAEGVAGAETILQLVSGLEADDVCVVLLSGGGSALLPAPVEGVSLADKLAVTRWLMHAGANVQDLNCVRKPLSRIKGGRLAGAAKAGLVISLIISDVIGDPLDVIASGPTVPDSATPRQALSVLETYDPSRQHVPASVWFYLQQAAEQQAAPPSFQSRVFHHVIGNNAVALAAAAEQAKALGYQVHSLGSDNADEARAVGQALARLGQQIRDQQLPLAPPVCVLSGGEPVVQLARTDQPRKGGRNQEVALAALLELWNDGLNDLVLLSGGTDGEDGPTDAAGAFAADAVRKAALELDLHPAEFLALNNSYPFFEQTDGLLKTGPTHTNVMDLRVLLIGQGSMTKPQ